MATPTEQHGARGGRARVVGSANQDGREPLVESPQTAGDASDAHQRGLDAAAGDPRSAEPDGTSHDRSATLDGESLHRPPPGAPPPDNTDTDARA